MQKVQNLSITQRPSWKDIDLLLVGFFLFKDLPPPPLSKVCQILGRHASASATTLGCVVQSSGCVVYSNLFNEVMLGGLGTEEPKALTLGQHVRVHVELILYELDVLNKS